ncbi:MAG: HEAT repeat domain-containing protein [Spirirestis rafaelensis WJT71-NPBG6]|jgi:HEAT repeat protein/energy-coupling factor transporter ATP-binding protein EcfA2|nr:HEAT repeat domain-containing protein [Spirirestis rafaelensis WJT71-NPBG6]
MAAISDLEFEGYFQAIADNFGRSSNLYTLTNVENKPHFYDMRLMVQTPQPKQPFAEKQNVETRNFASLPVLQGIRKYANEHVLLIGKPGSGKSTALERLLLEEAKLCLKAEKRKIPVLIELRSCSTSVVDLIQKFFRKHKLRLSTDNIDDLLFEEQLFLLFDGLNELPSDEARRELADFRENNPQIPMIFTTRDLGVGGDLGINKQLEMQPLTEQQMRSFVTAYLPQQGDEMLRQLSDRVRELGQTPLILKMLCEVFDYAKQVPNNRGELFRQFDKKVENLKQAVPVSEGLRLWKSELLQHLAFVMMQGENAKEKPTDFRLSISRGKAEAVLEDYLKNRVDFPGQKAKDWLQDLLKHYLIQTAADPEQIEFHHQLFQEYYAAEYLRNLLPSLSDAKLKRDYLNLLKWTEPLALMLGLVEDEAQAVRVVQLALDVDLMLGARLAGEVKREFQDKTVGLVNEQKLENRQEAPDWLKVQLLGKTRSQAAISPLQKALQHPDSDVRRAAAWVLGQVGEPAIPILFDILEHSDSGIRQNAIAVLGEIGGEIAIPRLIKALDDSEAYVRVRAVFSLEKLGSEIAIAGLVKALKDLEHDVREMARYALGQMNRELVIPTLLNALGNPDSSTRKNAAMMLGELGDEAAISGLSQAQEDLDMDVCLTVRYSLWKLNNKAVGSESRVKQDNQLFQQIEHEVKITRLLKTLEHPNPILRGNAVAELAGLGCKEVIPGLIKALEDSSAHARHNAINGIGSLFNKFPELQKDIEVVIPKLILALNDSDPSVRSEAVITLSLIGSEEAISGLIEALEDSNSFVRSSAARALGTFSSEQAIPALIKLLENIDFFVRTSASEALAKIKENSAAKYLPHLMTLIFTQSGQQAVTAISGIQNNCKFYNYEIAQSLPVEKENKPESQSSNSPNISYIIQGNVSNLIAGDFTVEGNQIGEQYKNKLNQKIKTMSETPKNQNTFNFHQAVGNVNAGDTTIAGDQVGVKHNYAPEQNINEALADIKKIIEQLQGKYPQATEAEAKEIIDVEFEEIKRTQPRQWQNFMSVKRLWNGGKTAAIKTGEHFAQENVWVKALVGFAEGVSENVD